MAPLVRVLLLTLLFLIVPGSATGAVGAPCGETAVLSIPAAPDAPDDVDQVLDDARAGRATTGWSRQGRGHRAGAGAPSDEIAASATSRLFGEGRACVPAAAHTIRAAASADTAPVTRTRAPPPG